MKSLMLIAALLALCPSVVHAVEAGDPNGAPADSPNSPYNPITQTGRLDTLGLLSPFSGVGFIDGGSGVLIDSTHVLTAAHLFGLNTDPTGISFALDSGAGYQSFTASAISLCPGWPGGMGYDDKYDLAIVTLSAPVPATYKTYSLYTGALTEGTTLTLVGYGATGDGVSGYYNTTFGRRVGKNNADGFLQADGSITETYTPGDYSYVYDFDGPTSATNELGGTTLGNDVETNIGGGDSGGPAFVLVNGQYQIAALNNYLVEFDANNDNIADFTYGTFGSGGGGAIVSAYTNGFLAPYAAPEPGAWAVFTLGGAGILAVKRRRQPVDC